MKERWLAAVGPTLGIALFAAALALLHRELGAYRHDDVLAHLRAIPHARIAAALGFTTLGYLSLTGYDTLAFRWIRSGLRYPRIALASFVAYVFSHNVGVSFFGGSAVRYRMFSSWGVAPADLVRAISFNVITFWLGFLGLGGALLTASPLPLPAAWHGVAATSRPLGLVLLGLLGAYLAWTLFGPRRLHVRGFEVELPGAGFTLAQLAISSLDWALASAVFFALLPPTAELGFAHVLGAFLLAQVLGVVSHVPAGLGVFETAMVVALSPWLRGDVVLGTAVAYRAVYYLLPLALALVLFVGFEASERPAAFRRARAWLVQWFPEVVPRFFTLATFAAGLVLLFSGATPAAPGRMEALHRFLPLALLELSHLLGSLTGIALLLLARSIQQRVDAGYHLGLVLLAGGAVFSLGKGLDWEEASVLGAMFVALLPCRRFFYRRSSLLAQSFSPGWMAAIASALLATTFVVALAHRHVEYANQLWWTFELEGHAPRSLRALVAGAVLLAWFALARLLRPAPPLPAPTTPEAIERVMPCVRASERSNAFLALLGDKRLLEHEGGTGFVMYGLSGRSWISMGDPVGPAEVRRELAWRFHEEADRHHGLTVFYEVSPDDLPVYLDLGLSLRKLGEEARVLLPDFELRGGSRKALRNTVNRMEREGCTFEIAPPEAVPALLDELEAVSNDWLASKRTREKRFSLGFFSRDYLRRTPVALVRRQGRVLAFANVWAGDAREELSIDLMRYCEEAPHGAMDFLFTQMLLWGRERGFRWFSLGMAPLSGFERHRLAPLWNRLGALLFRHGENLYNFQGLRSFKEKFDPVWEPRYLASPGALTLPVVLGNVASLISGGLGGVVSK